MGPDRKHLQTTKEVCEALNKAWGKTTAPFSLEISPTSLSDAIAKSDSPTGDCLGPDKKHFQTTKAVCEVFGKSWNKPTSFSAGTTTTSSSTNTSVSEAITQANANRSPLGDCIGPDKKHFDTAREVCESFNHAWGKSSSSFNPGVTTGTSASSSSSSSSISSNSSSDSSSSTNNSNSSGNNGNGKSKDQKK